MPGIETVSRNAELLSEYNAPARYEIVKHGTDVAIMALGKFFGLGKSVSEGLKKSHGIQATLINPRYACAVDETMLNVLPETGHRLIVTLEDGSLDGGFGEMIAGFYGRVNIKVLNYGAKKEFTDCVPIGELYDRYHLNAGRIISDIWDALHK